LLAKRLGVPAISTGEMFRQAAAVSDEFGRRVAAVLALGHLVDDTTTADVVRSRLAQPDARAGFILDGYPRSLAQADTLEQILAERGESLDAAIFLEVPEAEVVRRMSGRRDQAGRPDDRPEVVRERMRVYEESTTPLVGYYGRRGLLRRIDGGREIAEVAEAVAAALQLAPAGAVATAKSGR
jgi:adenylate kinase